MTSIFVAVCRSMERHRQSGRDHEDYDSARNARTAGLPRRRPPRLRIIRSLRALRGPNLPPTARASERGARWAPLST